MSRSQRTIVDGSVRSKRYAALNLKLMDASSTNIYTNIILGIVEFVLLLIYFVKTEEYATFRIVYYYQLIVAPCFGLLKLFEIILFPKSSIDPTQVDIAESDNTELSINRISQILLLFKILFVSLLIILPTLIEFVLGVMLVAAKYIITKNVSTNDLYIIHFTPAFLSVIPLCLKEIRISLKEIKNSLPDRTLDDALNRCVLFDSVLRTLVGIALNTLILVIGGLIGLNICNNFVL